MRKMNRVLALDSDGRTVTAGEGVTWKDLEDFVESKGFALPFVPTNAVGSTVGGAINSGSTGFGGLRGGRLRDVIANLEVVLPDGKLLTTAPHADAGGQLADLTSLFLGAEGTLGIITKATIRVVTKPESSKALAYAFPDLPAAARFLKAIVDSGLEPYHAVLADRDHFVFERALRADSPEPADLVLVGARGSKDDVADTERTLDVLAAKEKGKKLAVDLAERLWRERYNNYSARRLSRGLVTSYNLVPVARLPEALGTGAKIRKRLKLNGSVQAYPDDTTTAAALRAAGEPGASPPRGSGASSAGSRGGPSVEAGARAPGPGSRRGARRGKRSGGGWSGACAPAGGRWMCWMGARWRPSRARRK